MITSSALTAPAPGTIPQNTLPPAQLEKIKATAKDFEAMFVTQMVSHMFEGIKTDPTFGGGHGEDIFRGMLVQEYGKQVAKSGSFGVSDEIQREMIRMQQAR